MRMLGSALGEVVRQADGYGPAVFDSVEKMRALAQQWRKDEQSESLESLVNAAKVRAWGVYFRTSNDLQWLPTTPHALVGSQCQWSPMTST